MSLCLHIRAVQLGGGRFRGVWFWGVRFWGVRLQWEWGRGYGREGGRGGEERGAGEIMEGLRGWHIDKSPEHQSEATHLFYPESPSPKNLQNRLRNGHCKRPLEKFSQHKAIMLPN